ncbi:MAG: hypothetical protein FWE44_03130, partial [Defluviitaleaceae bacterium]|nr:hypothetical protein [Defluviitaleaceae bacterium]
MSQAKAKYITIGVLSIIIAALIVFCAIFIRQNNVLRQNLVNSQENVSQLMLLHETLEAEEFDDMHYRAIQRVLEEAPNRLRQVFDEAVELNSPEGFVMLPKNRILVSGHWHCAHTDTIYTMEAIFSFWLWNDEISIDLLSYSPFGWAGWRDPWQPDNSHWAPRHHPLETVPVRFYSMGGDWDDIWYNVEYLNGENFAEELAYFAM